MTIKKLLGLTSIISLAFFSTTGWSASVYSPTNQNVNFINSDSGCYVSGTACPDAILGIFDDSDMTYTGSYLAISLGQGGDTANFAQIIGQNIDYDLTNGSSQTPGSFTLTGSDNFLIDLRSPADSGSWLAPDTEICFSESESCSLTWTLSSSVLAIDLEKVSPPAAIPVPAAVWLFGSGLIGLVGIARRKKAA